MTHRRLLLATAAMATAFATATALAQAVKVEGIIMQARDGGAVVRTDAGERTVTIGSDTRIEQAGTRKPPAALIAGLPVTIEGRQVGSEIAADRIQYEEKDYRVALQIQAALSELASSTQEVREAVSHIGEYEVKAETSVFFSAGSAAIPENGKQDLLRLASEAKKYPGYFISVLGYADATGDAAADERLSNQRAQNVINLLKQSGDIQPGRVLAASAMGAVTLSGAPPEPTPDAGARRVTARIVVSKAQLPQP
jgi:outer membrane protein OmpA-like peptidoglycan-associated protein